MLQQEAEALRIYDRLFAWAQVERRMEKSSFSEQLSAIGDALATLTDAAYPSFNTLATLYNSQALYRQLIATRKCFHSEAALSPQEDTS